MKWKTWDLAKEKLADLAKKTGIESSAKTLNIGRVYLKTSDVKKDIKNWKKALKCD